MSKAITLRYFASVREALGTPAEPWQTDAADVAALRAELAARGPVHAEAFGAERALRCAVNQRMVDDAAAVHDGAEVAFFPPVTGG